MPAASNRPSPTADREGRTAGAGTTRHIDPAGQRRVGPISRRPTGKETWTVNKVLLTGRLTRDPELRSLASGKAVTQFSVATNEYAGNGKEKAEYHNIVTWDRLAEICGQYLGKGQQVALEGRLQTRSWDDDRGQRHWKTEVVATSVEMLSGRRKKDYDAESSAQALAAQATALGEAALGAIPADEPIAEEDAAA
jgi:single-strand DNA-binding protein